MIQNIRKFKVTNNITIHKISTAKDYFQLINLGQLPFLSKLLYLRDREREGEVELCLIITKLKFLRTIHRHLH